MQMSKPPTPQLSDKERKKRSKQARREGKKSKPADPCPWWIVMESQRSGEGHMWCWECNYETRPCHYCGAKIVRKQ